MAARSMRPSSALAYAGITSLLVPSSASSSFSSSSHSSQFSLHSTPLIPQAPLYTAPSFTCRASPLILPFVSPRKQCASYSTAASQKPPAGSVSYRLAVSYCGKGRKIDASRDVTVFDLAALRAGGRSAIAGAPPRSGQDAFFIGSLGDGTGKEKDASTKGGASDGDVVFGVADGVGGWTESGVDPSAFSEGLCRHMAHHAGGWDEQMEGALGSRALMQAGYDLTSEDPTVEGGGSTAVAAIGRRDGSLEVANLGDSGFVHYRPNATAFVSPPQVHAFNTPYQLSLIPAFILERSRNFGGEPLHDYPSDAAVTNHRVSHGDVLVFGTDGVWDNLNSGDVLDIVRKEMDMTGAWIVSAADSQGRSGEVVGGPDLADKTEWRSGSSTDGGSGPQKVGGASAADEETVLASVQERLAFKIAKHAQLAAVDMKRVSPFGRELKRWYPQEQWRGGKVDDIAVVVAVIVAN